MFFLEHKNIITNDGTGTVIKTWTVDGISKPTISDMSAYDSAAANYETKMQVLKKRAYCYPSLQEQFDMQYWDAINGTSKWKDAIAKVKSDNPKPS